MLTCDRCKALDGRSVQSLTFGLHYDGKPVGGEGSYAIDLCAECKRLACEEWWIHNCWVELRTVRPEGQILHRAQEPSHA